MINLQNEITYTLVTVVSAIYHFYIDGEDTSEFAVRQYNYMQKNYCNNPRYISDINDIIDVAKIPFCGWWNDFIDEISAELQYNIYRSTPALMVSDNGLWIPSEIVDDLYLAFKDVFSI